MVDHGSLSDNITPPGFEYGFRTEEAIPKPEWRPWHKPRKQWLRYNQWNKEIEALIATLRLQDRPLRYLSLPGDDLLDFRVVADLCDSTGVKKVRLVGFNSATDSVKSEDRVALAKQEVFSRDVVAENSDVHVDNFNAIADRKSIAYKFAVEKGPYDIVNLDLCTSFSGTQDEDSCYKAAWNLFEFQLNERTEPWVFLLTTRADYKKVNPHDLPRYWQLVSDNAQKSTDFHEGLSSAYVDVSCDIIENPVAHLAKLRSPKFERLFGLCVGKWLLSLITTSRRWTMRLSDSYWYRTKSSSHPNMLSLAFLFESCPVELTDPAGLASVRPTPVQAYDEVSQATDLLKKLIELTDLDVHLRDDPAAFEDAIAKSEALLGSAGYPVNTYRDWVLSVLPALPRRGSA